MAQVTINGITFESTGSAIADKVMAKSLAKKASKKRRPMSETDWNKMIARDMEAVEGDTDMNIYDLNDAAKRRQAGSSMRK